MIIRFIKKHSWILVLFFAVILFPQSLNIQTKLDGRLLITGLAIDKTDNEYLVTAQALTTGSGVQSKDKSVSMDFFSAKGKTIREAIENLASTSGKGTGVSQINYIIFGSSILSEDVSNVVDFVTRVAQVDTSVMLLVAKDGSKEIRNTRNLEIGTATSLRKVFLSKQKESTGFVTYTNDFLSNKFNPSSFGAINFLEIEIENNNNKSEKNDEANTQILTQNQTSQPESEELKKQGRIASKTPIALFSNGMYVGSLENQDEINGFLLANAKCKKGTFALENVKIDDKTLATVTIFSSKKKVSKKVWIENNKPKAKICISLSGNEIKEIISNSSSNQNLYIAENSFFSDDLKQALQNSIKEKVASTFKKCQNFGVDVFCFADKLNAHHSRAFKKYFSENTLQNFINEVDFSVEVSISKSK